MLSPADYASLPRRPSACCVRWSYKPLFLTKMVVSEKLWLRRCLWLASLLIGHDLADFLLPPSKTKTTVGNETGLKQVLRFALYCPLTMYISIDLSFSFIYFCDGVGTYCSILIAVKATSVTKSQLTSSLSLDQIGINLFNRIYDWHC